MHNKFNKQKQTQIINQVKNKTTYKESGGWSIEKDYAQHGPKKWKLKDSKGNRVASLDEKGKVVGK